MKPLTVKNKTFGDKTPKICIPITGRNEKEILDAAEKISALPADVAEWRADYYESVTDRDAFLRVLNTLKERLSGLLLLFTFRTKKEGGVRPLSDEDYLSLCQAAAKSGLIDLLDLELFTGAETADGAGKASDCGRKDPDPVTMVPNRSLLDPLISLAHTSGCRVILSSHDFQKTPPKDELYRRLVLMESMGADLAKLAVMPECEQDVLTLLSVTRKASDTISCPVITMSMGRLGTISRVSGSLTGSCLTFGTAGEESAPGQLPAELLKHILETL